jgi:small conductance mechanosensitive channel
MVASANRNVGRVCCAPRLVALGDATRSSARQRRVLVRIVNELANRVRKLPNQRATSTRKEFELTLAAPPSMFDFNQVWITIQRLATTFITTLPRLVVAVVVAGAFVLIGRLGRRLVERGAAERREHRTLQLALGRLVQAMIVVVGLLVGITAAFPTFTMGNLVGTLGVGGVAIGFAFKDIFQNFLAGILLLFTKPFTVGDQIIFKDFEGTVEDIQTRATYLRTYDGRRVVIPNSDLYMNAVTVNTAFASRRIEYDVTVAAMAAAEIDRARHVIVHATRRTEGVLDDPRPDALVIALGEGTVTLRARWWADARVPDALVAQDRVLAAIASAIHQHGLRIVGDAEMSAIATVAARATETEGTASDPAASDEAVVAPRGD